jgi:uncharacterized protein (DUF924 family)
VTGWAAQVLDFWFALPPEQWWRGSEPLDEEIRKRFLPLWEQERERMPESFLGSAAEALAAIILFDQFPRNMFRGDAAQFATDPLALALATGAVDAGLDGQVPPDRRGFFYMPFQHSEEIEDQRRSLLLFTRLGDPHLLHYARLHHDIVERFGRFPHRNAILGRTPRPDEIAAGDVHPW